MPDLKRKYAGAPNQIALDNKRIMYVENPNSGLVKAKSIDYEVEVYIFLSKIYKSSVVLKKIYSYCIICITKMIH